MRDEKGGAATQQRGQAGLHEAFGLSVDARGSFVEDEQTRVSKQSPHKAEELALTVAEQAAALAHIGVVAVCEAHNEIVRSNGLRCGYDGCIAGGGIAIAQVVTHSAAEEKRFLQDEANLPAQMFLG